MKIKIELYKDEELLGKAEVGNFNDAEAELGRLGRFWEKSQITPMLEEQEEGDRGEDDNEASKEQEPQA